MSMVHSGLKASVPTEQDEMMTTYKNGTLIAFSEGEYSGYGYCGHVRALQDLEIHALAGYFEGSYKAKDEWDRPDPQAFVGWLVSNGYVEAVDYEEIHLGSYGRLSVQA